MVRIFFACHWNICRSPMAECMMRDLLIYRQIEDQFIIDSGAIADDYVGHEMMDGAKRKLDSVGVPYEDDRCARQVRQDDYDNCDYMICMDEDNERRLKERFGGDPEGKIHLLFEYTGRDDKNIPDPWYTEDFDETYDCMLLGLSGLLTDLKEHGKYL